MKPILLTILSLLLLSTVVDAEYNLYDRNKYHYDFPQRRNHQIVNPQPEEPPEAQFPPGNSYDYDYDYDYDGNYPCEQQEECL